MATIQRYTYKVGSIQQLGGQDVVTLNYLQNPFTVTVLIDIVSGLANYAIEFTTDDMSGDPSQFRWNALPSAPAGQTTTNLYTLNFPVTAIRLNLASLTGELRLSAIQSPGSL